MKVGFRKKKSKTKGKNVLLLEGSVQALSEPFFGNRSCNLQLGSAGQARLPEKQRDVASTVHHGTILLAFNGYK